MVRARVVAPAEPADLHLDLDGWYRRGGHRCTVHVTTVEFAAALRGGLAEELGPWRLTGTDARPSDPGGHRQEDPWAEDNVALDRHGRTPSGQHRTNMWVWSAGLTKSHPPLSVGAKYELRCSYNGFILVQDATAPILRRPGVRPTTRDVIVVDAVYTDAGELVTFPEYLSVWRRIARRLRKIADVSGPPYGHPLWDGYRWSAAALAEAHAVAATS